MTHRLAPPKATSTKPKPTLKPAATKQKKSGESVADLLKNQTPIPPPQTSATATTFSNMQNMQNLSRSRSPINKTFDKPVSPISSRESSMSVSESEYKYTVRNLPQNIATQKSFYSFLITTINLRSILTLKVNYNRTALLITSAPITPAIINQFRTASGDANITVDPINKKSLNTPFPKVPTFSVVIRIVEHDITEADIINQNPILKINRRHRIISKKTNRPTPLIRIISDDKPTIDHLLTQGITIFSRVYDCEVSHPPPPTPLQCSKCFQLGHGPNDCPNKPICPKCPESHHPSKCTVITAKCPFCQGSHPAWSRQCPVIKETPITENTPFVPTKIIDPPSEFADRDIAEDPRQPPL
ncbi:uncharacterized protein LOC107399155 [Tribolium castaneum]|uniref:uncharacterized protein LOC107399155 n=1 Tax=Tribolium castaneum TaxID=7070 RepID=UPI0030FE65AA